MRRPEFVVEYRVDGDLPRCFFVNRAAGVQVAVEAWEARACDRYPNTVTRQERVAGGPQVDVIFIDLAG